MPTAAAARGGLEPDLLDEVIWWQADDFWRYRLRAEVAIIRSCAHRLSAVPEFARQVADRKGIALSTGGPSSRSYRHLV